MTPRRNLAAARAGRLTPAVLSLLVSWVMGAAAAGAQLSPHGGQFQVNTYTTGSQQRISAATDGRGILIVTWSGEGPGGVQVSGRRVSASGFPIGDQFLVSNLTGLGIDESQVGADSSGRFVVAWQSYVTAGNDTSLTSIQARRFAADGTPAGAQFQVNATTADFQTQPDVAKAAGGAFVVVWASETSAGSDAEGTSIQGRLYDAAGTPLTAEFQVNSHTPGDQSKPAVAMAPGGSFVVAWESYSSPGTDGDFRSIQARRFNAGGAPLAAQFQVNGYTTGVQSAPDVTIDGSGRAVVAWTSNEATGDADLESVQAQRYAADGTPAGVQFQVNQYTTSAQANPSVSADPAGRFVVAWGSDGSAGSDTSATSLQARRFGPTGAPLTADFQVNNYTTSYQDYPAVSADGGGNFVVVWNSFGSNGTDNEGWGVHARRYDQLFRDGFINGTTSRWSSVTP